MTVPNRLIKSLPMGADVAGSLASGRTEPLAKGLNQVPITVKNPHAPLINTPIRSTASLLFQAQKKINKGQNRKAVLGQLQTSTKRSAAAVVPPASPPPASFGGAGFSGAVAGQIGHAADPGFTTATTLRPTPVQ